jgi:hypothetical protein
MKKMRKLIPAFAMLMIAAIMMSTASYAWFSIGTTAKATGMQVQATSDSSMIIHEDSRFLGADDLVEFTDAPASLMPVTIEDGKWKAPDNLSSDVDVQTGALKNNAQLVEIATPEGTYCKLYKVYLASASDEMVGNLTIAFDGLEANGIYLHNALSVQVLVYTATGGTETLEVMTGNVVNVKNSATKNTVTVEGITIPCAYATGDDGVLNYNQTSGDYVKVEFRVYFDGALTDDNGGYYVRNASMDTTTIDFDVNFSFASN